MIFLKTKNLIFQFERFYVNICKIINLRKKSVSYRQTDLLTDKVIHRGAMLLKKSSKLPHAAEKAYETQIREAAKKSSFLSGLAPQRGLNGCATKEKRTCFLM